MIVTPRFAVMALVVVLQCLGVVRGTHLAVEEEECPNDCADIFKRLDGNGIQETKFQIRGEPKSGTGTSEEWAVAGLSSTCTYLNALYGDQSCRIVGYGPPSKNRYEVHDMIFEPGLPSLSGPGTCPCANVQRVNISMTIHHKHMMPVERGCSFWHPRAIIEDAKAACTPQDGRQLEDQVDLWNCVQQADCVVHNDRLQLSVMRDPREVTVSTYFHRKRTQPGKLEKEVGVGSVDEFFQKYLGSICMWVSLRYFFFSEIMGDQSELFWYDDHEADPIDWHGRYFAFIGLNMPLPKVVGMALFASGGEDINRVLDFEAKGIDDHPGGNSGVARNFRDDLGADSLAMMDDVMRKWMPPVILKRFGIPLY